MEKVFKFIFKSILRFLEKFLSSVGEVFSSIKPTTCALQWVLFLRLIIPGESIGWIVCTELKAESLWLKSSNHERGLAADRIASRVGDLLTIVVNESTKTMNNLSIDRSKDASINDNINKFIFSPDALGLKHKGETPGINLTGSNSTKGSGTVNNTQTLNARVSVTIIDVLPNGNLVIEGARMIDFSGETQFAILRGFVRPDDIATDNTVDSTCISDARVQFISEGALTDMQKRGWLIKFNDMINPI